MKFNRGLAAALGLMLVATSVLAADAPTVKSLLADGYSVVGAVASPIGPGVLLEKGASVYMCFIAETPNSPTVKTNYCKPVE
ncbi:MAG TPA: hypothetical protein VII91_08920 [Bauldia sp.]